MIQSISQRDIDKSDKFSISNFYNFIILFHVSFIKNTFIWLFDLIKYSEILKSEEKIEETCRNSTKFLFEYSETENL